MLPLQQESFCCPVLPLPALLLLRAECSSKLLIEAACRLAGVGSDAGRGG